MTRPSGQAPVPPGGSDKVALSGPIRSLWGFRKVGVVILSEGREWVNDASFAEDGLKGQQQ